MIKKEKSKSEIKKKNIIGYWVWIGIPLLFISTYLIFSISIIYQKQGLDDVFKFLEQQGYIINHGFSGIYQPGNIVQVTELVNGRQVSFAKPILVISASSCFPDKKPEKYPFTLPQHSGKTSLSLKAGAKIVAALLPDLALDSKTIANYSLQLDTIHTVVYERLDLSRKFSPQCVIKIQNALTDGDKLDWFKVINEAIIADSLRFEITWRTDTSANARKIIKDKVARKIIHITEPDNKQRVAANISSVLNADTNKKLVMEAKGVVILAYKFRPIEKQKIASEQTIKKHLSVSGSAGDTAGIGNNENKSKIAVQLVQEKLAFLVRFDHPFVKGDRFRFKITPNQDGNLYIFHHKPGKKLVLLWPQPENLLSGQFAHQVSRGITTEIPPFPANFYFDEELFEERFFVAIADSQDNSSMQKEIENFAVRGQFDSNGETKRVGYDPGQDFKNPDLYFNKILAESKAQLVTFKLGQ